MEATFGALIRRAREQKNLKAREVAAKLDIDPGTLSRLENGNYKETPSPDVVRRLSEVLDLPERRLLEALGYAIVEDGPSYDAEFFVMLDTVQKWPSRQRDLLWRYIEAVTAAMDAIEPPDEPERTESVS